MNTTSSLEDDDPMREPRAYNQSIYLMVAMPYLVLGVVAFKIYRGIKSAQQNAQGGSDAMTDVQPRMSEAAPRSSAIRG